MDYESGEITTPRPNHVARHPSRRAPDYLAHTPADLGSSDGDGDIDTVMTDEDRTPKASRYTESYDRKYSIVDLNLDQARVLILHASFMALRELHDSALAFERSLPWNELESGMLGITELHQLTIAPDFPSMDGMNKQQQLQNFVMVMSTGETSGWVRATTQQIMKWIGGLGGVNDVKAWNSNQLFQEVTAELHRVYRAEQTWMMEHNLCGTDESNWMRIMTQVDAAFQTLCAYHQSTGWQGDAGEEALREIAEDIDFCKMYDPTWAAKHEQYWITSCHPIGNTQLWRAVLEFTVPRIRTWLGERKVACRPLRVLNLLLPVTAELPQQPMLETPNIGLAQGSPININIVSGNLLNAMGETLITPRNGTMTGHEGNAVSDQAPSSSFISPHSQELYQGIQAAMDYNAAMQAAAALIGMSTQQPQHELSPLPLDWPRTLPPMFLHSFEYKSPGAISSGKYSPFNDTPTRYGERLATPADLEAAEMANKRAKATSSPAAPSLDGPINDAGWTPPPGAARDAFGQNLTPEQQAIPVRPTASCIARMGRDNFLKASRINNRILDPDLDEEYSEEGAERTEALGEQIMRNLRK